MKRPTLTGSIRAALVGGMLLSRLETDALMSPHPGLETHQLAQQATRQGQERHGETGADQP